MLAVNVRLTVNAPHRAVRPSTRSSYVGDPGRCRIYVNRNSNIRFLGNAGTLHRTMVEGRSAKVERPGSMVILSEREGSRLPGEGSRWGRDASPSHRPPPARGRGPSLRSALHGGVGVQDDTSFTPEAYARRPLTSRRSRNPSPRRLNARTARKMLPPGARTNQGSSFW